MAHLSGILVAGGVSDVIVVSRPGDEELELEVARLGARVRTVPNPHAEQGQLSSLLAALDAADRPGVHALLVTPVDAPYVRDHTVAALLSAFATRGVPLVRATRRGRHGHPVVFGRAVFDALRHADARLGAKAVVQAHGHEAIDVEVDDDGVLDDIDRPEDYDRAVGNAPKK